MTTKLSRQGEVAILTLAGPLSIGKGDIALREAIKNVLEEGYRDIVIEVDQVSAMDSSGLGELVACKQAAVNKQAEVVLCGTGNKVQEVLEMTRLISGFSIYSNMSDALAHFEPTDTNRRVAAADPLLRHIRAVLKEARLQKFARAERERKQKQARAEREHAKAELERKEKLVRAKQDLKTAELELQRLCSREVCAWKNQPARKGGSGTLRSKIQNWKQDKSGIWYGEQCTRHWEDFEIPEMPQKAGPSQAMVYFPEWRISITKDDALAIESFASRKKALERTIVELKKKTQSLRRV